jgi:hypothetical protein
MKPFCLWAINEYRPIRSFSSCQTPTVIYGKQKPLQRVQQKGKSEQKRMKNCLADDQ